MSNRLALLLVLYLVAITAAIVLAINDSGARSQPYDNQNRFGGNEQQSAAEANYVCTANGRLDGLNDVTRNIVLTNCVYGFLNGQYYAASKGQRAPAVEKVEKIIQ